jgi:hypothetical protein
VDEWQGFKPLLEVLQVPPWMYPLFIGFGIAHQFAAASFSWWSRGVSFVSALLLACVFAGISCGEHSLSNLECATRVVVLLAGALIAEGITNKIPGVPQYKEKVKPKEGQEP